MLFRSDEIGPSLRRAKAQVTRTSGGQYNAGGQGGGSGYQGGGQQGGYNAGGGQQGGGYRGGGQGAGSGYQGGGQQQPTYNAPAGGSSDDPWATGGTTSFGDEPPF